MPTIAPFRALRAAPGRRSPTWVAGAQAPPLTADHLRAAAAHGHLVRDRVPALYRYEIAFGPPESRRHATGFLARMALEATGETEAAGGTAGGGDAVRAQLGHDVEPLVLRYTDERGWVDEVLSSNAFDEVTRFTDDEGVEHRLWRVERQEGVQEAVAQFEDKALRLESGAEILQAARTNWQESGKATDGSILVLLAPEGPEPAPWRCGLVFSPLDEPRPRPWQELAGDPGKPQWRTPPLG